MYKLKPEERGRNILYERQVAHLHDLHRKKVEGATSHLVKLGFATKPKEVPQVVRANLKKRMQEDERLAQIEAENARLLASMTKIYEAPDTKTRLKKPPVSSLNVNLRRREMQRVTNDNMRMLKNLEATPSYYNHKVWESERKETEHILTYMGLYPYEDGKGVRRKEPKKKQSDMDDAWLRSISSLSRKSALSLPELTKPIETSYRNQNRPESSASDVLPTWALPPMVQPKSNEEEMEQEEPSAPSRAPQKPSGPLKPLKGSTARKSSSSDSDGGTPRMVSTKKSTRMPAAAQEPKPAASLSPQKQKVVKEETDADQKAEGDKAAKAGSTAPISKPAKAVRYAKEVEEDSSDDDKPVAKKAVAKKAEPQPQPEASIEKPADTKEDGNVAAGKNDSDSDSEDEVKGEEPEAVAKTAASSVQVEKSQEDSPTEEMPRADVEDSNDVDGDEGSGEKVKTGSEEIPVAEAKKKLAATPYEWPGSKKNLTEDVANDGASDDENVPGEDAEKSATEAKKKLVAQPYDWPGSKKDLLAEDSTFKDEQKQAEEAKKKLAAQPYDWPGSKKNLLAEESPAADTQADLTQIPEGNAETVPTESLESTVRSVLNSVVANALSGAGLPMPEGEPAAAVGHTSPVAEILPPTDASEPAANSNTESLNAADSKKALLEDPPQTISAISEDAVAQADPADNGKDSNTHEPAVDVAVLSNPTDLGKPDMNESARSAAILVMRDIVSNACAALHIDESSPAEVSGARVDVGSAEDGTTDKIAVPREAASEAAAGTSVVEDGAGNDSAKSADRPQVSDGPVAEQLGAIEDEITVVEQVGESRPSTGKMEVGEKDAKAAADAAVGDLVRKASSAAVLEAARVSTPSPHDAIDSGNGEEVPADVSHVSTTGIDPNSIDSEAARHEAAVKIQAIGRGGLDRERVKQIREEKAQTQAEGAGENSGAKTASEEQAPAQDKAPKDEAVEAAEPTSSSFDGGAQTAAADAPRVEMAAEAVNEPVNAQVNEHNGESRPSTGKMQVDEKDAKSAVDAVIGDLVRKASFGATLGGGTEAFVEEPAKTNESDEVANLDTTAAESSVGTAPENSADMDLAPEASTGDVAKADLAPVASTGDVQKADLAPEASTGDVAKADLAPEALTGDVAKADLAPETPASDAPKSGIAPEALTDATNAIADVESEEKQQRRQHEAAVKIQSVERGVRDRARVKQMQSEKYVTAEGSESVPQTGEQVAEQQSEGNEGVMQKEVVEEEGGDTTNVHDEAAQHEAAVKIQAIGRGGRDRERVKQIREKRAQTQGQSESEAADVAEVSAAEGSTEQTAAQDTPTGVDKETEEAGVVETTATAEPVSGEDTKQIESISVETTDATPETAEAGVVETAATSAGEGTELVSGEDTTQVESASAETAAGTAARSEGTAPVSGEDTAQVESISPETADTIPEANVSNEKA